MKLLAAAVFYRQCPHRSVIVNRAVIGSKGGWKLSTIVLSCKAFHDWSIKTTEIYCIYKTGTALMYFLKQHLIAFVD